MPNYLGGGGGGLPGPYVGQIDVSPIANFLQNIPQQREQNLLNQEKQQLFQQQQQNYSLEHKQKIFDIFSRAAGASTDEEFASKVLPLAQKITGEQDPFMGMDRASLAVFGKQETPQLTEIGGTTPGSRQKAFVTPSGKPVNVGPEITPQTFDSAYDDATIDSMAEQALAGDKSVFTQLGRSNAGAKVTARLRSRMYQLGAERGMSPTDIAAATAEYAGLQAGQRTIGQAGARADRAAVEAQTLLPQVLITSEKVSRTDYPSLNEIILAGEKGIGDENVVRFGIAVNSLVNVYSRAINPTGTPTESDKSHARELLSTAWSNGQIGAAVDQLNIEMQAARSSTAKAREELSGQFTNKNSGDTTTDPSKMSDDELLKALGK